MNILHVLSQFEVTGAETYAAVLADEQVRAGHSVWIISDTFHARTVAEVLSLPIGKRDLFQRLNNILSLRRIIREKRVDIVHAHSRAASWVSYYATRRGPVPLVSTLHGRQHVHLSSKIFHIYGEKVIAVCEGIREHLIRELDYAPGAVSVVRNGIDLSTWTSKAQKKRHAHVISLVGRLSGPKGVVAEKIVGEVFPLVKRTIPDVELHIVGGMNETDGLKEQISTVNENSTTSGIRYKGFVENVREVYQRSSLVIGSGRVVMEALAAGAQVVAVGESNYIGPVIESIPTLALETNFGDAGPTVELDVARMAGDIIESLKRRKSVRSAWGRELVCSEYDSRKIAQKVSAIYAEAISVKKAISEIPVLLYHRVTSGMPPGTKHGIYVTEANFERQLSFLKEGGYESLTFEDLQSILHGTRAIPDRPVILTFDDGYEDNYEYAFPLLEKYAFKAVIFLIGNPSLKSNAWDTGDGEPMAMLLTNAQIREMRQYGIEFGSHSLNHVNMSAIPQAQVDVELRRSKQILEKRIGAPVHSFAYPYGKLNETVKRSVREAGYFFGVASDSGPRNFWNDRYEVRRIQVFPGTSLFSFWKKTSGWYHRYKGIV